MNAEKALPLSHKDDSQHTKNVTAVEEPFTTGIGPQQEDRHVKNGDITKSMGSVLRSVTKDTLTEPEKAPRQ